MDRRERERDGTTEKVLDLAQGQRDARLRLLTDQVPVVVWSTDEKLRFTSVTGAGLKMLGVSPSEIMDVSLRDYFSGRDPVENLLLVHERALAGESIHVEMRMQNREYELHVEPMLDDAAHITGAVGVALDVTERKQLARERGVWQAHARHQQRLEAIGTLASGVAHEINNPVQSIMNYAQLIARRAGASEVSTYAQEILHEAQRVASIVKGLLSYAHQEGEPYTDVQLHEVVTSTLALVSALLRKEGIRVDIDLVDDMPAARCHPQQIQQVVMNLVGNAREALNERYPNAHEDKRMFVSGRSWHRNGGSFVRLTIEDHGVGIPPERLDKIFDPFWTSKAQGEAAGLGLSVCQGIVIEHGGAISVESEPGRFTRFHVDLPAAEAMHDERSDRENASNTTLR
jgi:PAS domain S-box-containing protein